MDAGRDEQQLRELVASVAAAYFSNSHVAPTDVRSVIADIAGALGEVRSFASTERAQEAPVAPPVPAQPAPAAEEPRKLTRAQIQRSITPEALISFEDGKSYKTLRRHLRVRGLTEADYRAKWGLPKDYPMVAPDYSRARSELAKTIGLSQHGAKARSKRNGAKPRGQAASRTAAKPRSIGRGRGTGRGRAPAQPA